LTDFGVGKREAAPEEFPPSKAVPKVEPGEGVLNTEIGKWSLKFS
jgi:hypothetical protein